MDKIKTKVLDVTIGKYEFDSITVKLNDVKTEICFDKKDDVIKYIDTDIYLSNKNGEYFITPIDTKK